MQIRHILILFSLSFSLTLFANIDSTGVENNNGKKIIIHKVEAKETYYSLARKYGVTPKSVMDFNNNKPLQIGMMLSIPTERPFSETGSQNSVTNLNDSYITYKVRPKETLYSISEQFNTTVADLREINNIKGSNLSIGQTLKIRQQTSAVPVPASKSESITQAAAPVQEEIKEIPDTKEESNLKIGMNRYGLREHSERGIAIWIEDENVDGTKSLVLHRTAPIGTVMKITNPMTEKSTFAKVVGKFTENESTKNVIVVLTKAVADLIGAIDKRFQVSIDYGLNE